MKKALFIMVMLAAGAASAESASPGSYKIDPAHSAAFFTVTHVGVSRQVGRFDSVEGSFSVGAKPGQSHVSVQIPVASVDTNFAKRDTHLKSPDFFNATQYPNMSFESTKVDLDAKGQGTLEGKLTLHGVTKVVDFKLQAVGAGKDPWGGYRAGYVATASIKRSDFGMNYLPQAISDEVDLSINLEGIRQ